MQGEQLPRDKAPTLFHHGVRASRLPSSQAVGHDATRDGKPGVCPPSISLIPFLAYPLRLRQVPNLAAHRGVGPAVLASGEKRTTSPQ